LFKNFSLNYKVTTNLIYKLKEEIKELYPLKAEDYKDVGRLSNEGSGFPTAI